MMRAIGTLTTQDGEILIVNDFLPAIPLSEARRLYKKEKLTIFAAGVMRDRLIELLEEK